MTGPQPKAATRKLPRVFRGEPDWSHDFRQKWLAMLWTAMNRSGEGYRRPKAERDAPRADKRTVPADPTRFEKRGTRSEQQAKEMT